MMRLRDMRASDEILSAEFDRFRLWHAGSQDTDSYRLQLFVALCDHNPPTLQTDRQTDIPTNGQTDVMLVA